MKRVSQGGQNVYFAFDLNRGKSELLYLLFLRGSAAKRVASQFTRPLLNMTQNFQKEDIWIKWHFRMPFFNKITFSRVSHLSWKCETHCGAHMIVEIVNVWTPQWNCCVFGCCPKRIADSKSILDSQDNPQWCGLKCHLRGFVGKERERTKIIEGGRIIFFLLFFLLRGRDMREEESKIRILIDSKDSHKSHV